MSDNIRIDAGIKRILINDGPDYIEFNASDTVFVEKFYKVVGVFEKKLADYEDRGSVLDQDNRVNDDGLPVNMADRIGFVREVCQFAHEQIDYLFGPGTSLKVFRGAESLDMIEQFFTGLTPIVKQARDSKVNKYRAMKR